jgi:hypothetical protein
MQGAPATRSQTDLFFFGPTPIPIAENRHIVFGPIPRNFGFVSTDLMSRDGSASDQACRTGRSQESSQVCLYEVFEVLINEVDVFAHAHI